MPFKKGDDGIPNYIKTDYTDGPRGQPTSIDTNIGGKVIDTGLHGGTDITDPVINSGVTKPTDNNSNEPPTRPYNPNEHRGPGFGPKDSPGNPDPKTSLPPGSGAAESYVCGWLVVIDGPGKGKSVVVGPGQSAISRSAAGRIRLDFGDMSITSNQQLIVFYDDVEHEFVVAPGNGSSLNRLNGQLLAAPTPMKTGDVLKVGATTLRFVAFCDKSFNWNAT